MSAAACTVRMCKGSHFFVSVKERRGKVWNEAGGGCEVAREYESRVWRAFGEAWEGLRREYVFLTLFVGWDWAVSGNVGNFIMGMF